MKIGILSHYVKLPSYQPVGAGETHRMDVSRQVVDTLVSYLDSVEGVDYLLSRELAEGIGAEDGVGYSEMSSSCDMVVTVGSDGTVLGTVRAMEDVPVLGVNTGRVGFLADVNADEVLDEIDRVIDGFEVERRTRLEVSVNGDVVARALNEAVVVASRPGKIMEFEIAHGGELVDSLRADGVVTATPTGSTAYSLSEGGPIMKPVLDAFLLTPLAPFRVNFSSWVVGSDCDVTISPVRTERAATLVIDGDAMTDVDRDDEVRFRRADNDAKFVKTDKSFFEKVRERLG